MAVRDIPTPTETYASARSATQDTSPRCGDDALLREHDFVILSRPKEGPAVWVRRGRTYTHSEAVKLAILLREKALKELQSKSSDLP